MKVFQALRQLAGIVDWKKYGVRIGYCPVCEQQRPMVKLNDDEVAVRCIVCRARAVTMSMANVIQHLVPDIRSRSVYELSARGPLVRYLR